MGKQGKIIAPSGLNIQEHEMSTARALADAGYDIEFSRRTWGKRVTSPDVVINGVMWEMKSPLASDRKAIERNLRKACRQSANVVFDSQRMKGASDAEIERELRRLRRHVRAVKRLRFVNRRREVVDIE